MWYLASISIYLTLVFSSKDGNRSGQDREGKWCSSSHCGCHEWQDLCWWVLSISVLLSRRDLNPPPDIWSSNNNNNLIKKILTVFPHAYMCAQSQSLAGFWLPTKKQYFQALYNNSYTTHCCLYLYFKVCLVRILKCWPTLDKML